MARVIRAGSAVLHAAQLEAIDDAARIRRLAEVEAERIREQAREEGLGAARAESAAHLIETAALRAQVLREAEAALIPLVRSVVERVLHASLEADASRIAAVVRAHLERLQRAQHVEVHVHPDDAAALASTSFASPPTSIVADASLTRGDVVLQSNLGRIDARLEVQLDALERALRTGQTGRTP
jgi:flagellar biosynthesis/type III secretory pathway protein FliH